jgi:[acyl-carrier-protein] S-malonyltransferase
MMIKNFKRIAFLFPGQGAQYPGMAQDFVKNFSAARLTFEEADDVLKRPLSTIILEGPQESLTETKNSQTGIYVTSMAIFRVLQEIYELKPFVCAGLSLGEYTALTVADWLTFRQALPLVQHRGQFMNEACESTTGKMAVIMGLDAHVVEGFVRELNLPRDLWVANFNCPGQVVISGTLRGIEAGTAAAKAHHAKRVLPLQVHGAFHSGLMQQAKEKLAPYIQQAPLVKGSSKLVMNVSGDFISDVEQVRHNLIEQVTHSVCWEQGIHAMEGEHIDLYIEFGPGKTLSGMNKRMGVKAPTITIEKVEDLDQLSQLEKNGELL